jgi:hypothetical protein
MELSLDDVMDATEEATDAVPVDDSGAQFDPESKALIAQAQALQVKTEADFARAGELMVASLELQKQIREFFRPLKERAHAAHKAICDAEAEQLAEPMAVNGILNPRIVAFHNAKEAERRAEEERRAAEARRLEEESRLEEAAALEAAGENGLAHQVLEAPSFVPPPAVPRSTPKVAGMAIRGTWRAECTDLMALVGAVAEGKASLSLLAVNESALNARAKSDKEHFSIPGCRAFLEQRAGGAGGRR